MTGFFHRRFPTTDNASSVEENLFNAGVYPVLDRGRLETLDDPVICGVMQSYRRYFRYDCNQRIRLL